MSAKNGKPKITPGSSLIPKVETQRFFRRYCYWVGVIRDCPYDGVSLGGISFPKVEEEVTHNPDTNKTAHDNIWVVNGAGDDVSMVVLTYGAEN